MASSGAGVLSSGGVCCQVHQLEGCAVKWRCRAHEVEGRSLRLRARDDL